MHFQNFKQDIPFSETESSIFSDTYVQEISSINQITCQESFFTPWKLESQNLANETFAPSAGSDFLALYQENQALKKKIRELEDSLRDSSKKTRIQHNLSNPTQSTGWLTSQKTSFSEDCEPVKKNLISDFEEIHECHCPMKRGRGYTCEKHPHKFVKIAIMKSIGTLKF
jgi:hypothetical protein